MIYTIYKVTNNINGKIYLGKHQTKNPNDGYYGSGKGIKNAICEYGKENFTKEVLFIFDNEQDMNDKERELIDEKFVSRKDTYNMGVGGEGGAHFKGKTHTEETRKIIKQKRALQKSRKLSDEHRRKISEAMRGNSNTKGKTLSEEHKRKISKGVKRKQAQRGEVVSR